MQELDSSSLETQFMFHQKSLKNSQFKPYFNSEKQKFQNYLHQFIQILSRKNKDIVILKTGCFDNSQLSSSAV